MVQPGKDRRANSRECRAERDPAARPNGGKSRFPSEAAKSETDPAPRGGKPSGDVAAKDKDLDSLLEKYGENPDKPAPEDRRPGA